MLTLKRVLFVASVVLASSGAQAQTTTYIGGPKSGLTRTVNVSAKPTGSEKANSSYAQAIFVRALPPLARNDVSGGARAIGADNAPYQPTVRRRAFRTPPPADYRASGPASGAQAIGSDR